MGCAHWRDELCTKLWPFNHTSLGGGTRGQVDQGSSHFSLL